VLANGGLADGNARKGRAWDHFSGVRDSPGWRSGGFWRRTSYTVKVLHYLGIGRLPKRPMVDATGGTERTALEVARIQVQRGHDVTVASKAEDGWQGSWQGVRLLHLKPYSWARVCSFGRFTGPHLPLMVLIHSGRFDLIHFHEYSDTRLISTRPTVMHFHNDPVGDQSVAQYAEAAPEYWARVGKSAAQIAVSEFVAGRLRLAHQNAGSNALPANIVKVPGGVGSNPVLPQKRKGDRERIRRSLGLKDTDVLFLFSGAIRPEKGVDYLARAFARLSEESPDARLAIAGGSKLWVEPGWLHGNAPDSTEQQVRDILAPAIARNRAFMLGIVPPLEIDAYYAASDVFVLPSMFQETFGLVLLEAFSAGLPVIAFRSGGIPELVENRRNGIVVDQGDEEALYQSMRELMLDRDLRERLGSAAARIPAGFPWENTVDRLEAIYRGVLQR
jgi:glycosyltransferase involved in cell wall biosynthesis